LGRIKADTKLVMGIGACQGVSFQYSMEPEFLRSEDRLEILEVAPLAVYVEQSQRN